MHAMITSGDLDSPDSYKPHAVVLNLIARLEVNLYLSIF